MTSWAEKPLGELPLIGGRLARVDARLERYTPRTLFRLIGVIGLRGVLDRLMDQPKLHKINRMLDRFAAEQPDVFFLQIGAYDGHTNDHIYPHIAKNTNWSGIVIEPIASAYQSLTQTYSDRPNVKAVQVAIHDTESERTMFRASNEAQATSRLGLLSSFDKDNLLSRSWMLGPNGSDFIVEETVKCITLPQLLKDQAVEKVDILLIDTEGLDGLVLNQFDLERLRPTFVMFEHDHMTIQKIETNLSRFRSVGYSFIPMSVDTFCYRQS